MIEAVFSSIMELFLGDNHISDIWPHSIAWFLYGTAALIFVFNLAYANCRRGHWASKLVFNLLNFLALTVCVMFLGIQMYWIKYSIIANDPTTMAMLWTTFHYYNGVSYIIYASSLFVYMRWKIPLINSFEDDTITKLD